MKNKKLSLSLLSLSALALSGCDTPSVKISIFLYDQTDTFVASLNSQLLRLLPSSYGVETYDGERSQSTQSRQIIQEFSSGSSSAMVVNMVDRLSSGAFIEKAYQVDVPMLFFNRKPLESTMAPEGDEAYSQWVLENCYYIGTEPSYEGTVQAQIADAFFQKHGADSNGNGTLDVAIFKGEQNHQDTEERTSFSINALRELGYEVNIVKTVYCDWTYEQAYIAASELDLDEIDLLLCNNDEMALGAIAYLKTLIDDDGETPFYERFFPIVGNDATEGGRAAVSEGTMIGTVINDYVLQAEIIIQLLDFLIEGAEKPKNITSVSISGNYYYVQGSPIYADF